MPDARVTHATGSWRDLRSRLDSGDLPDLILMDPYSKAEVGYRVIMQLRACHPEIGLVIFSARHDPSTVQMAMCHGVRAFISKSASSEQLEHALQRARRGETCFPEQDDGGLLSGAAVHAARLGERLEYLTPVKIRILLMMADGLLNKQIAFELNLSESTVKSHVTAILRTLGVTNRTQAAVAAAMIARDGVFQHFRRHYAYARLGGARGVQLPVPAA